MWSLNLKENNICLANNFCGLPSCLVQGFSNYGLRPHLRLRNVILGSQNKLVWQIRYKNFCKLYKKFKSLNKSAVNLFLLHFWSNAVLHAVSCLLGCLPEISNDNNQPSTTTYMLLHAGLRSQSPRFLGEVRVRFLITLGVRFFLSDSGSPIGSFFTSHS